MLLSKTAYKTPAKPIWQYENKNNPSLLNISFTNEQLTFFIPFNPQLPVLHLRSNLFILMHTAQTISTIKSSISTTHCTGTVKNPPLLRSFVLRLKPHIPFLTEPRSVYVTAVTALTTSLPTTFRNSLRIHYTTLLHGHEVL